MHACLTTSSPTGGPTRWYPAHSIREGRTTGRVQRKFEQDSERFISTTPNRRYSQRKSHNRPTSPSSFDNSSDDDIIGPITPPPILHDLARYVKSAKERPGPYKRTNPNIIERFCGEECSGCNGSTTLVDKQRDKARLERRMKSMSPGARVQATIAIGATVEWRRARAVAAALKIDAIVQHKKFMSLTLESEANAYVNAISEPPETSIEAMANCTAVELDDCEDCSVAVYRAELESFVIAEEELDDVENLTLQLMGLDASTTSSDKDNLDGSFGSTCGTSRNSTESDD